MSKELIINGCSKTNTGYRQILLDTNFKLRPILTKMKSGYIPDRTTIQLYPKAGDVLFRSEWGSTWNKYTIKIRQSNKTWRVAKGKEVSSLFRKLHSKYDWASGFLSPHQGRITSYLPVDEETIVEKNKRRLLMKFISEYNLHSFFDSKESYFVLDDILSGPKRGLNLKPVKDKSILEYVPVEKSTIGTMVDIYTKDYIIAINEKMKPRMLLCVYKEEHISNYAYDKNTYKDGESIKQYVPEDTKYILKVTKGAFVKNHHSHGYSIDIYDIT